MRTEQPLQISANELRALRMRAQCLSPRLSRDKLADVVKILCGVNAQLPSAMALSLRARLEGLTIEDVESSRVRDRALVRTWCMRGTMHLLAVEDLDWLLSAIAPSVVQSGWRWLQKRGGLERARAEKVLNAAYRILRKNGPMTRPKLMQAVSQDLEDDVTSAAAGVVWLNGMLGRVCFGPDQGAKPTYVALDDWLGREVNLAKEPDYPKLARRYLRGYGPAGPRDLAAWWNLPLTIAKEAWSSLQSELVELQVEGQTIWWLASELAASKDFPAGRMVRLLPAFDTYLLGYDDRDFAVPPAYQERVFHGGQLVPVILVDGLASGTWRYKQHGKEMDIQVTPFSSFTAEVRDLISAEVDDIGRFYGLTGKLSYTSDR